MIKTESDDIEEKLKQVKDKGYEIVQKRVIDIDTWGYTHYETYEIIYARSGQAKVIKCAIPLCYNIIWKLDDENKNVWIRRSLTSSRFKSVTCSSHFQ